MSAFFCFFFQSFVTLCWVDSVKLKDGKEGRKEGGDEGMELSLDGEKRCSALYLLISLEQQASRPRYPARVGW
jgi:hypothetical protein